jgi:16S rRNA U516 pseudouridylate synthase RsuA-like enzyme
MTKRFKFTISEDQMIDIKKFANKRGISVAELIRVALKNYTGWKGNPHMNPYIEPENRYNRID